MMIEICGTCHAPPSASSTTFLYGIWTLLDIDIDIEFEFNLGLGLEIPYEISWHLLFL